MASKRLLLAVLVRNKESGNDFRRRCDGRLVSSSSSAIRYVLRHVVFPRDVYLSSSTFRISESSRLYEVDLYWTSPEQNAKKHRVRMGTTRPPIGLLGSNSISGLRRRCCKLDLIRQVHPCNGRLRRRIRTPPDCNSLPLSSAALVPDCNNPHEMRRAYEKHGLWDSS